MQENIAARLQGASSPNHNNWRCIFFIQVKTIFSLPESHVASVVSVTHTPFHVLAVVLHSRLSFSFCLILLLVVVDRLKYFELLFYSNMFLPFFSIGDVAKSKAGQMRKFNCVDGMQHSIFKSRKCYAADCSLSSIYAFGCNCNSDFHAPTSTTSSTYVSSFEIAFDNGGSSNYTSHPCAFHPEARYPQAAFSALIFFYWGD